MSSTLEFARCNGCGKTPSQIHGYVEAATECGLSPLSYVLEEEGTLNPANLHFWCDECYIKAGCPEGVAE